MNITTSLLKIIQSLIEKPSQTIRELSRTTKIAYYLIQKNIVNLNKSGVVRQEKIGRSLLCSLNPKIAFDQIVIAELNKKEEFFRQNKHIKIVLEELGEKSETPFFVMLLFGSYAKSQQRAKSDIDILMIVEDTKQMRAFEARMYDVLRITSLKIHPTIVDRKSFEKMLKKQEELNVANESLNTHILIHGSEAYWTMRIKDGR